jgi:hypothetical protein
MIPQEIIDYIENPDHKEGMVTAILYKLKNKQKKQIGIIKPHLYSVVDKQPGKELLLDNVPLIRVTQRGNAVVVRVDISKYKIKLPPEGLFVGLEYLGIEKNNTIDDSESTPFGIWHNVDVDFGTSYSRFKGKITNNYGTFCFGLEVK